MDSNFSIPAIAIALVLLLILAALHFIGARMAENRKPVYFLSLIILLAGSLIIPVIHAGDKLTSLPLWTAYRILGIPGFFSIGNHHATMDASLFGTIFLHHFASITISVFLVKTLLKRFGTA